MTQGPGHLVPLTFDLSELVQRSVATLYSHLVTRPTGRALRIGIESQVSELNAPCVSVLDFQQVVVLDYSCADETVAKLIQRFQPADRPAEVYFVARGISERHRDPIEEVLKRHGLALVAEVEGDGFTLLGEVSSLEREAWTVLERLHRACLDDIAIGLGATTDAASAALDELDRHRVIARGRDADAYYALTTLLSA